MPHIDLPDVQSSQATSRFKLTRVGVTGVKRQIPVQRPNKTSLTILNVTMDLFVDLPATQKGSHMSRNLELIAKLIDTNIQKPVPDLETFCANTAELLLTKHEYATYSEVKAAAEYFYDVQYPSGQQGTEPCTLIAEARKKRDGGSRKLIGVRVTGMTACPCAMEVVRSLDERARDIPAPTHNQRNIGTLIIEVPSTHNIVDADDLIQIVQDSFSSPTYSLLKRRQEAELVLRAHERPKFVEDVVRDILTKILARYQNLPDEVIVIACSESEESIHKHNAYAERITTLGELRK
jgi:GTP cyclohydrolase IV